MQLETGLAHGNTRATARRVDLTEAGPLEAKSGGHDCVEGGWRGVDELEKAGCSLGGSRADHHGR